LRLWRLTTRKEWKIGGWMDDSNKDDVKEEKKDIRGERAR
jgi:hypothetical protein